MQICTRSSATSLLIVAAFICFFSTSYATFNSMEINKPTLVQIAPGKSVARNVSGLRTDEWIAITALPDDSDPKKTQSQTGRITVKVLRNEKKQELCNLTAAYQSCLTRQANTTLLFYLICDEQQEQEGCKFNIRVTQQAQNQALKVLPTQQTPTMLNFSDSIVQIVRFDAPKSGRLLLNLAFENLDGKIDESRMSFVVKPTSYTVGGADTLIIEFSGNISGSNAVVAAETNCKDQCEWAGAIVASPETLLFADVYSYNEGRTGLSEDFEYLDLIHPNQRAHYQIDLRQGAEGSRIADWDFLVVHCEFFKIQEKAAIDIYLHPDTDPATISSQQQGSSSPFEYHFQFQNSLAPSSDDEAFEKDEQVAKEYNILVSMEYLKQNEYKGEMFYIDLESKVEEPFNLAVSSYKKDDLQINIELGEIIAQKLDYEAVQVFDLNASTFLQQNHTMTVRLFSQAGNADLYARVYKNDDDYDASYTDLKEQYLEGSATAEKLEEINISPDCKDKLLCQYLIYVVCVSADPKCEFLLELTTGRERSEEVKENTAIENTIRRGEVYYYKFHVVKRDSISKLLVQVSSQLVQIYVSTSDQCKRPGPDCAGVLKGNANRGISLNSKQLSGVQTLYVAVGAIRHTTYSLTVRVERKDQVSIVQLTDGTSVTGEVSMSNPVIYFLYEAKVEAEHDIQFNLWGPKNRLEMLVNSDGSIPSDEGEGFQFISTTNFLFINHTSKEFVAEGRYIVAVKLLAYNDADLQDSKEELHISFKLMGSATASVKILEMGETFYDYVLPFSDNVYMFVIDPQKQLAFIQRSFEVSEELVQNVNFYIGTNAFNQVTDLKFKLAGSEKGIFELNTDTISKLCDLNLDYCPIYLEIENNGATRVGYVLTVWENDLAVELREGYQQTYKLFNVDGYMNFYYRPSHPDVPINFYLYSYYGRTNFSVRVIDELHPYSNNGSAIEGPVLPQEWPYPRESEVVNYLSGQHNSHSFTVEPGSLKSCAPRCVILLSVSFLEEDEYNHKEATKFDDEFTLLVSSRYSQISGNGGRIEFTLKDEESKYFFFDMREFVQMSNPKQSLHCYVTALSGHALIAASIKDDLHDRLPHHAIQSDFLSYTNYLEITSKELRQVAKKLKILPQSLTDWSNSNPTLVIEVMAYGASSGKFVLSLYTSSDKQQQVVDVLHGVPVEFLVQPKKDTIFSFFNYFNSAFKVRITRESGFGSLRVVLCDASQELAESAAIERCKQQFTRDGDDDGDDDDDEDDNGDDESSTQLRGSDSGSVSIHLKSQLFCQYCYYLIRISNNGLGKGEDGVVQDLKGFLHILLQDDATWLQEGHSLIDSVPSAQVAFYRISVAQTEAANLNIIVYSGAPQVYVNYNFERSIEKFKDGPFIANKGTPYINVHVPARQELMRKDKTFTPYNRPIAQVSENSDTDDLSNTFIETELYVAVYNPPSSENKLNASYSIAFSAGALDLFLYDGQIVHETLAPQKRLLLTYQYFDSDAPAVVTITVLGNSVEVDDIEVKLDRLVAQSVQQLTAAQQKFTKDSSKADSDNEFDGETEIPIEHVTRRGNTVTFALPEELGSYNIVLTNKNSKHKAELSVLINTRDMTLVPRNTTVEHLMDPESVNQYEIFSPKRGVLMFELLDCAGDLQFGIEQDYDKFMQQDFTFETNIVAGRNFFTPVKVVSGPVYVALTSGDDNAFYALRATWYEKDTNVPNLRLQPGDSGSVKAERDHDGNAIIQFKPLVCLRCTAAEKKNTKVTYELLVAEDLEFLNVQGKCGAETYFQHSDKEMQDAVTKQKLIPSEHLPNTNSKTFSIALDERTNITKQVKLEKHQTTYFVSVRAIVQKFTNAQNEILILYDNAIVPPNNQTFSGNPYQFIAMIVGAATMVLCICCIVTLCARRVYKNTLKDVTQQKQPRNVRRPVEVEPTTTQELSYMPSNKDKNGTAQSVEELDSQANSDRDIHYQTKGAPADDSFAEFSLDKSFKVTTKQGYATLNEDNI